MIKSTKSTINFSNYTLNNGLRVIVQPDNNTNLAAVNLIYKVGSRDEDPDQTGFAHLFEHLMFGGSKNIPDFDTPLQFAGGENNAFTNSDYTNYYITLPTQHLETAFWLESDRMLQLDFSLKSLEVQKKVVIEEFKQNYLNQPYGDIWHILRDLTYKKHPYRWPTIGLDPKHIENANINQVKSFFYKHYGPNNAILSVVGKVDPNEVIGLAEKWFAGIPTIQTENRNIVQEPRQNKLKMIEVFRDVPTEVIFHCFHTLGRSTKEFYVADLLTDILAGGQSSRLFQKLTKKKGIATEADAFITGELDPGLFVLKGMPVDGVDLPELSQELLQEVGMIASSGLTKKELTKVKNKSEANFLYAKTSILNRAINLGYYTLLGNTELINSDIENYQSVTEEDLVDYANKVLTLNNMSTLFYRKKN